MNRDDEHLLAFYRAHAVEEPDVSLDASILRAARRRTLPVPAMAALLCLATLAAVVTGFSPPQRHPAVAWHMVLPGLEDGRGRYLASDARVRLAAEQSGLNLPAQ
jgi:hypothetical protein